ncbi:MAG TPA: flagellar protein [Bacillota bacterium]|nr:flagellar protein [Bacillota bacterium]
MKLRNICPDCIRREEEEYLSLANYLRENKGCTLVELSEATKVPIPQIRKYIIEGRIIISDNPNIEYSCESCGAMIKKGKTCSKCTETINQLASEAEKRFADPKKQENKSSGYRSHLK